MVVRVLKALWYCIWAIIVAFLSISLALAIIVNFIRNGGYIGLVTIVSSIILAGLSYWAAKGAIALVRWAYYTLKTGDAHGEF
jgi:uncharacterized membrane protein (DUF485 family)